jgi:hypothetical protein
VAGLVFARAAEIPKWNVIMLWHRVVLNLFECLQFKKL